MHEAVYKDDTKSNEGDINIQAMEKVSIERVDQRNILKEEKSHPPISQLVDGLTKWFKEVDKLDIFLEMEKYSRLINDFKCLIGNVYYFLLL